MSIEQENSCNRTAVNAVGGTMGVAKGWTVLLSPRLAQPKAKHKKYFKEIKGEYKNIQYYSVNNNNITCR